MSQTTASVRAAGDPSPNNLPINVVSHHIATTFIDVISLTLPIENLLRWIPLAALTRISVRVQLLRNRARLVPRDQIELLTTLIKPIDDDTYECTSRIKIGQRTMTLGLKLSREDRTGWHADEAEII